jgi:hypothetical protein
MTLRESITYAIAYLGMVGVISAVAFALFFH